MARLQRFDCLQSPFRDLVWLANVTVMDNVLKCGLAYIQGQIPSDQVLVDLHGNQICWIWIPLDIAKAANYSLLASPDDDLEFKLKLPQTHV